MKAGTLKPRTALMRQLVVHGFDRGTAARGAELLEEFARLPALSPGQAHLGCRITLSDKLRTSERLIVAEGREQTRVQEAGYQASTACTYAHRGFRTVLLPRPTSKEREWPKQEPEEETDPGPFLV